MHGTSNGGPHTLPYTASVMVNDYQEDHRGVMQNCADIVHSAAVLLEECHLIKCKQASGRLQSTEDCIPLLYHFNHFNMSHLVDPTVVSKISLCHRSLLDTSK